MEMKWTPEQQKVIELRDRNILVSAAAGSGKTAVLVERILGKLTRKDHPIDIDQLLIVTFTRAAAGEMRERLTEAVENYLEQDPENEHLQRQQTLIHNAQITTIDGFCSYVIRNYFHTIDLDPGRTGCVAADTRGKPPAWLRQARQDFFNQRGRDQTAETGCGKRGA